MNNKKNEAGDLQPEERKLQVFNFTDDTEMSSIRTQIIEGNPWFVAKDVCDALGIINSRRAVGFLDDDERGVYTIYTLGGNQEMAIVNESGLYNLIFQSRKPNAKMFRKWITSEVIPSIRRTRRYVPAEQLQPIAGVHPIICNGEVGYPRLELLKAAGYSPKCGMVQELKNKYPEHYFTIGRTACVSPEFARLRLKQGEVRQMEIQLRDDHKKRLEA
ncbi:putative phage-encoded protein [Bacteroidales bacterium Barb6XT]|nr:putative phage-encoded protein [Bacteroidales bacterium Barb6XT]